MSTVIPVDLTKTGGKLFKPGGQVIDQQLLAELSPAATTAGSKTDSAATSPPTTEQSKTCRHCGRDPQADPDHPTSEDLLEFAKCVWRDEPFRKSYTFYGGVISVTFRTLTADEADAATRQVLIESSSDNSMTGALAAMYLMNRGEEYQFALSIDSLSSGPNKLAAAKDMKLAQRLDLVRSILKGQVGYQTVRTAFRTFLGITKKLIESGSDPSFWPAISPDGISPALPSPATRA